MSCVVTCSSLIGREPEPALTCDPPSFPWARSPAAKVGRSAVLEVLGAAPAVVLRVRSLSRGPLFHSRAAPVRRDTLWVLLLSPLGVA